ncbi:MAG: hypothetical protein A2138_07955 [Deltaproteobacteria bacterium RBG_16_71_12]|nr:MAG: hypothetical protein A2138_07955 [Deltaproteobacteria bacterium RBG_16_71_12]
MSFAKSVISRPMSERLKVSFFSNTLASRSISRRKRSILANLGSLVTAKATGRGIMFVLLSPGCCLSDFCNSGYHSSSAKFSSSSPCSALVMGP